MSINIATISGHLGKDPEVKHLDGGTAVAKFTMATTEKYKNKQGEFVSDTTWHNITCWRSLAELAEKYLSKGKEITVIGKISNRSYEDKDGNKRYTSEIIADSIHFHGSKEGAKNESQQSSQPVNHPEPPEELSSEGDDLPF